MAEQSTIASDKLCALTGLSDRRHRQLAKDGYFPPPINGQYQLSPTIQGLFRYYREMSARARGSLADEKLAKTAAERKLAELELRKRTRELLPARTVERAWSYLLQGVRARWLQLPARAVPMFALWGDARACEQWIEGEVESILRDLAENPEYSAPDDDDEHDEETPKQDDAAA